jgi:hypothetical protein
MSSEEVFGDFLRASHGLHPDELTALAVRCAERLGGRDVVLLVVAIDQVELRALGEDLEFSVEQSEAGRAYRTESPIFEALGDETRMWIPVIDSAERMGVLGVTVDRVGAASLSAWLALASGLGELLTSKSRYGDGITNRRRTRPVSLAAEMRWAELPPLTFTTSQVAISGLLEPAYDIAGDTFDYAVNGHSLSFAILDAMGHGLEASRMASVAVASYRHHRRLGRDLVETLQEMDRVVADEFGESRFVTGQLGTLDLDRGTVRIVNAGHPRPFRFDHRGHVSQVECEPCVPMGLGPTEVVQAELALDPGDVLLLYSDGVTESRSATGEFFGDQRLAELGGQLVRAAERPAEVLRKIVRTVIDFEGPQLRDDATLVYVGWSPPGR